MRGVGGDRRSDDSTIKKNNVQLDAPKGNSAGRFMQVAERLGEISQIENFQPSALYALASNNVPHGEFLPWLDAEFGWSRDTARNFMNVAAVFGEKAKISSFQPSALYALASNNVPQEVRDDFAAVAEAGHPVTHAAVREAIADRLQNL